MLIAVLSSGANSCVQQLWLAVVVAIVVIVVVIAIIIAVLNGSDNSNSGSDLGPKPCPNCVPLSAMFYVPRSTHWLKERVYGINQVRFR